MKNNSISLISAVSLFLFSLGLVSCNLPTREQVSVTPSAGSEIIEQNLPLPQDTGSEVEMIINNHSFEWSRPAEGPTVTPIVLSIEKRGEEGIVISRDTLPEINRGSSGSDFYYNSSDTSNNAAPAVQNFNPGTMSDSMEAVGFNPVSGAVTLPGQPLHLDVTLKNTGTTTWQTFYKVVDISENPMTVQKEFNLPYAVAPGGTAVLSIYMTAPSMLGNYTESFQIQDAYGAVFGKFDYYMSVGDFSYITAIPTLTATITPTYYSAEGITATPDSLAWMCIDPERSKLQDCYSFCAEYSYREEFRYCFYDGQRYLTPVPENN